MLNMSPLYLSNTLVAAFAAAMLVPAMLVARAAAELHDVRRAIRARRERREARKPHAD
jgi:hypothetical protein